MNMGRKNQFSSQETYPKKKKVFSNMIKKGQFYIFTAIVLCSVVFFGSLNKVSVSEPYQNFQVYYENYISEGINSINPVIILLNGNINLTLFYTAASYLLLV